MMIRSFRSKALKRYWLKADAKGLRPDWINQVRIILSRLDVAREPKEMNVVGLKFHTLSGDSSGRHAVLVSRNWRITFAWDGDDAVEVDLEDYHGR